MANKVGEKGQAVIEKEIRDRLGVGPGWLALQRLVDDHVEIYFVMPEHNRSLMGSLNQYVKPGLDQGLSWSEIRDKAWSEAVKDWELRDNEAVDGIS